MKKIFCFCTCVALICLAGCAKETEPPKGPTDKTKNLSVLGTANSYIVNAPGAYSFDATVMGNGVSTVNAPVSKMSPVSAEILWQDVANLLSGVELRDGNVRFSAGGISGNAVVATYDDAGKILWSWHIWITDYNPASTPPRLNGLTWMTRNLGATTGDYDETAGAKGFVYQWGRKDPFPSGSGWSDLADITVYDASGAASSDLFRAEEVAAASNLANAIANPTTYYWGTRDTGDFGPYDWLTTDAAAMNDHLWETTADRGKTLFDPCPPGWRVPRKESWKGVSETNFVWDDAAAGRRHGVLGYYPATGSRGAATGEWSFVGNMGEYWSSAAADEQYYVSTLYFLMGFLDTQNNSNRSSGLPVRCVSETSVDPGEEPQPAETIVMDRITEASYIGMDGADMSSNYYIGISNVDFELDDQEQQVPTGAGMIMYLDIYGEAALDPDAAELPEGAYRTGDTKISGTVVKANTWAREKLQNGEIVYRKVSGGQVKVKHTVTGCQIEGTFTATDGNEFVVRYDGPITFTNHTPDATVPAIENPVNSTFKRVLATWEYSGDVDRFTVRLVDGTYNSSTQTLSDGYLVVADLFSEPISTKKNIQIEPGVYRLGSDYVTPMTYAPGSFFTMMGLPFLYGTYCVEAHSGSERLLYGFATQGTIEVKRSGDSYEFVVDVVSPEGVALKGTYPMAEIEFLDNTLEKPAGDWLSILTENKTVVFSEEDAAECRIWRYESDYEGLMEYEVLVDNNTTDEAFQLYLYVPAGAASCAGTYTELTDPDNPTAGRFVPGYKDMAVLRGTWGYLYYNFTISSYLGAPATEGTIEIKDLEDGKIEIQYILKDDAEPKNTIRSTWSGAVRYID